MLVPMTMETTNVEKKNRLMKKTQKKMQTMSGMAMLLARNLQPLGSLLPKAAEPF